MTGSMISGASAADAVEQRLLARVPTLRKLFIRNLAIDAHIGIHDFEQDSTQPVLINITLYLEPSGRPVRDSIAEVFNYDLVHDGVHAMISGRHINLQETLVEEIADLCLGFAPVLAVRVASEKINVYPDAESVGIELVRLREE